MSSLMVPWIILVLISRKIIYIEEWSIMTMAMAKKIDMLIHRNMMTSWQGNVFFVTGPFVGESTGHRWIPFTKGQ